MAKQSMGLIPLSFYLLHMIELILTDGSLYDLFWMCHLCNLTLAIGVFVNSRLVVSVSAVWIVAGFPLWLLEMIMTGEWRITSMIAHFGGLFISFVVLYHMRFLKGSWKYAWIWVILVQLFCRFVTPPELNVNVAHEIKSEWQGTFSKYYQYWIFCHTISIFILLFWEWILLKLFSEKNQKRKQYSD